MLLEPGLQWNRLRFTVCSCIQTRKVLQGGALFDWCRRRRTRLATCLKESRNVDKKILCVLPRRARKKRYIVRDFSKNTRTYENCSLMEGAVQKALGHMIKNKSNNLEPHFPTSATKSRSLDDTKTAVALPHCSESTRDSIAGRWTFWLEVTPDLCPRVASPTKKMWKADFRDKSTTGRTSTSVWFTHDVP